ncbi:MAG TPA: lipase family protein [Nocardioidaceae bacterium]|nr:lipase family protein [Nocardioidaceae bacterium]
MRRVLVSGALVLPLLVVPPTEALRVEQPRALAGTVVAAKPLAQSKWIPNTTRRAFVLKYVTRDANGNRTFSTGRVFIPKGRPPVGGWPVISWAHGTTGLADACAPSRSAPTTRDGNYLGTWMRQGYAVVASDYAGLGTRGLMAYLHGRSTARNVVDMVKAARSFTANRKPWLRLSRRWVVIGQSQGAGGAIYTARFATRFGGARLDYRGAVGTGTPAYIENILNPFGPNVPPVALPGALDAYMAYIFAGLRSVHPELGIDSILTETGVDVLEKAEALCLGPLIDAIKGKAVGSWFSAPVASLPGFTDTVRDYLAMPERGFDKPFFMGHGTLDTDVPLATTLPYVTALLLNGEPVTFRTYVTNHSGTMAASLKDSVPFVARLFR